MFANVRVAFKQVLGNLRKFSESGRKSSENRQFVVIWSILVFLCNKQNNKWLRRRKEP